MYKKLIRNDVRKSKMITATITSFIFMAAMLTSLAVSLIVNLAGAIDNMMLEAKAPHFMQMHTGDIDMERLENFVNSRNDVETYQVLEFLNIDGSEITIGENSLAWSVQDNGFSKQSESFDFLLDLNGDVIHPANGEIYFPIYYMKEGSAKIGDAVSIRGVTFTVAGFLRDSQMNSALVSSKRFLVSENDFEKIKDFGVMEYMIEFQLKDTSSISAFESDYLTAGLETNGPPAITYSLIKIINAIADGLMIAVLMLISILIIIVAFLCIRFTLLAKMEEDYKEIGVLKAVGLRVSQIKKLYTAKYGVIAGTACILGFFASLLIQNPFMENIKLYMGESNLSLNGLIFAVLGAALIFLTVMLYVNGVLRRFRKISAAQAIRFGAPQEKTKSARSFSLSKNRLFSRNVFLGIKDVFSRKKLYVTMLLVVIVSSFIMIVPQNIYNTISSKSFVTYMGIGDCDLSFYIQQTQTDNISQKAAEIENILADDANIEKYTVISTAMFDMESSDGTIQKLKVDLGDHSVFPIAYSKGRAPQTETEIAISTLNADDLEKTIGDEIVLIVNGEKMRLSICGVYSDITNGGKNTKAVFKTMQPEILSVSIPVMLNDSSLTEETVSLYSQLFPFAKVSGIDEHIDQMFGSTVAAIKIASYVSIAAAVFLTVLITLLFMKMLVTKDRCPIAILKSMGFTSSEIRTQYIARSVIVLVVGVILGTVLANTLGELVGVALISYFGASTFNFVVDPFFAYLFSPLLIAICIYIATWFGVSDVRILKISEHIKES